MRKLTIIASIMTVVMFVFLIPVNTSKAQSDMVKDTQFLDISQNSARLEISLDSLSETATLYYLVVADGSDLDNELKGDDDSTLISKVTDPTNMISPDLKDDIFENGSRSPINSAGQDVVLNLDVEPNNTFHLYTVLKGQSDNGFTEILFDTTGYKEFSTNSFPQLEDGIGDDDEGLHLTEARNDIPEDWNFIRGVDASVNGEVFLNFKENIKLMHNGDPAKLVEDGKISILDSQTNENIAGTPEVDPNNPKRLIIPYLSRDIEKKKEYIINVEKGVLASNINSTIGQFNGSNINYLFYTEKSPSVISAYFSPGADYFNPDNPAFRMDANNDIYKIPELLGVHKIGVGVNQALIVQFDDEINIVDNATEQLQIRTTPHKPGLDFDNVEVNDQNKTELIINFTTNHPDRLLDYDTIYEITIPSIVIRDRYAAEGQEDGEDIVIKFKTADGFNNAFVDKTAQELNSGILKTDSDNIAIEIPKIYIQELETIHYQDGLIGDERKASNLTNIEIKADDDVAEIRMVTDRGVRPNITRGPDERFSATFAGLNSDITDIKITAYDDYGKVLERRSFRLQGSPGSEFKNDYVPEITEEFGSTVSLYDLMKDPEVMENVLEQIPVSELNRIGVFHPYFAPYDLITETNNNQ